MLKLPFCLKTVLLIHTALDIVEDMQPFLSVELGDRDFLEKWILRHQHRYYPEEFDQWLTQVCKNLRSKEIEFWQLLSMPLPQSQAQLIEESINFPFFTVLIQLAKNRVTSLETTQIVNYLCTLGIGIEQRNTTLSHVGEWFVCNAVQELPIEQFHQLREYITQFFLRPSIDFDIEVSRACACDLIIAVGAGDLLKVRPDGGLSVEVMAIEKISKVFQGELSLL